MALYEFYGESCPHCLDMMPIIDKLISEGIKIEKLETWQNTENANKQKDLDKDMCGGVPFFINTDSGQWICGSTTEEKLRAWASGEKLS
ncbi:MAG: hypothetical protein ABIH21_04580 [Patescibacteria group bacterium]